MTRVRLACVFVLTLGAVAFAGCGTATTLDEDSGITVGDTGPGGHDTGIITPRVDSGTTTTVDSGGVVTFDAGPGPGRDGGFTRPDAGPPMPGNDAGTTTGVMCGTAVCGASEVCCITRGAGGMMASAACTAAGACTGIAASCDGPEDCATGEACCGTGGATGMGSAACTPEAMCGFIRLCHVAADCNAGDMCCPFMGANVCSPRCF